MDCEDIVEVTERLLRNDPTLKRIRLDDEWFSFSDDVLEKFATAMESSSIENPELSISVFTRHCGFIGFIRFIARIVQCHCIHSLYLFCESSIDDFSSIVEAISQNSAIKILRINIHVFVKECTASLAKSLRSERSSLNSLNLFRSGLGDEGCIVLSEALRSYSSLKELDIGYCDIGTDGAKAIGQLLGSSGCAIEELGISSNHIGDEGCVAVMAGLLENPSFRVLNMRFCGIGKEGVEAIANVLSSGKCTIQKLCLCDRGIGDEGCNLIMEALRNNNSVYELHLARSDIGDEGMKSIANVLQNNHADCLGNLSLCWNRRIGVEGFKALAIALSQNSSLENLNLSGCYVHDDGCVHLMNVLSQNSSLKVVHLGHYDTGGKGVKVIANFLQKNAGSIHELHLTGNGFDEESLIEIAKALHFNTHLKKLVFDDAILGGREKVWSAFDDAAYHNYSLQELVDNSLQELVDNSLQELFDNEEFEAYEKCEDYKRSIEKHLDVNKKLGPVKAEMVKTGLFPNQILPHLTTASCFVVALSKVASLGHLSPVFDLVCKQPILFDLDHCVAERAKKSAEWNES